MLSNLLKSIYGVVNKLILMIMTIIALDREGNHNVELFDVLVCSAFGAHFKFNRNK